MVNGLLVAVPATPVALARSTRFAAPPDTVTELNVASPALAFTVVVPPSVTPAGGDCRASVTGPLKDVTRLPKLSRISTVMGERFTPESAFVGCVTNAIVAAAPGAAVAVKVTGEPDNPGAVAVTVIGAADAPSVNVVDASPLASVVTV
jgi:hypothetical protein